MPLRHPERSSLGSRRYLILFAVALLPLSACSDQSGDPLEPAADTNKPKPQTAVVTFEHGAFLGDSESARDSVAESIVAFAQKVGSKPSIIKTFYRLDDDFSSRGWPGQTIRTIRDAGATNLIAVDLRWTGAPTTDLLQAIARGDADEHIRRLATGLGDLRAPVLLEPGWEINGNWNYPWQG